MILRRVFSSFNSKSEDLRSKIYTQRHRKCNSKVSISDSDSI